MQESVDFQLLSAVRYDLSRPWQSLLRLPLSEATDRTSPVLLISYHRDRMANAGDAFGWPDAVKKLRSPSISQEMTALAEEAIQQDKSQNAKDASNASVGDEVPNGYKVRLIRIMS